MKRNRLIALAVIFGASAFLMPPILLSAQEAKTPVISNPLSAEESKIIEDEAVIFSQILYLYATEALEKPADLRLCAYEMFRLKPNENSCRDKYSLWSTKEEAELDQSDIEGKFGGVGLELADKEGKIVVVSPIDGTPAFRAGFKPEDEIVKINNKPVLNFMDANERIRGKPDTSVEITVKRGGQEILFRVVREIITVHTVSAKTINSSYGAIGYVKVRKFSEIMPGEFRKEITNLRDKGINKVVLDFRNNPGGLLNSALDILYDFARPSDTLITMRERNKETVFDTNYVTLMLIRKDFFLEGIKALIMRKPGMFRDMKVVVLINKGSASASEIFAGTMKDWGFQIIGSNSFGKGVGQELFPLADGSVLRLTTFEFLAGNSKTKINNVGVIPTYEVSDPTPSSPPETPREDLQLKKAIEIISR